MQTNVGLHDHFSSAVVTLQYHCLPRVEKYLSPNNIVLVQLQCATTCFAIMLDGTELNFLRSLEGGVPAGEPTPLASVHVHRSTGSRQDGIISFTDHVVFLASCQGGFATASVSISSAGGREMDTG